ncbi:MAG: 3-deoxy-D-manno-octulosonic acid transferase, partial [Nitrospirae bacterium]|nr:3-deoxy-D-manno-octulosonic acid transferase [Nitrospirota bacterium]
GPENRLAYLRERLGMSSYGRADVWVHAVSVGEVMAALPFVKAFSKEFPGLKIAFSTTTYTGQKIARDKFPEADRIMYMPWDTGLCVKRVVRAINPRIFITIETELWPFLFRTLKKSGARVVLLNGRISPGSFHGYSRLKPFMKKVFSCMDFLSVQSLIDAERMISIGANKYKIEIMGNFKFDIEPGREEPASWPEALKGRIVLAGSTHRGEDEIILDAFGNAKRDIPDLILILAPRHPERFNEVEDILRKRGLSYIRRSELRAQTSDVILLDTIGELSHLYSKADIAFVGGSLLPFGGHNILEPAYWGKPILFGPHMENFPVAKDFLREDAAMMVEDSGSLAKAIVDLLKDNRKAEQIGHRAKNIIDRNTGAVKKAISIVRSYIGSA